MKNIINHAGVAGILAFIALIAVTNNAEAKRRQAPGPMVCKLQPLEMGASPDKPFVLVCERERNRK